MVGVLCISTARALMWLPLVFEAHSESAVRSVALSQFSNEVIEARLLHGTATWAARYRCSPCTRLVQRVSALSKRGLLRYEEVLRL